MSSSYNKVILVGNLTADPVIKETPQGMKVASFSVATSRKWKDADGETKEDTEFHNIVAWRKLAEIIEKYVVKGMKVQIDGYLKTRTYEKEVGGQTVKMYRTEIVCGEFLMLSSKDRATAKSQESEGASDEPATRYKPKPEEEISIEDIPF